MSTEVQQRASFSTIRYAMCWEDADILVEALRCSGAPHCLSIGSAGDNSFALLAGGADSVTVTEMNPAQIACIELRRAAYLALDHTALLELLGIRAFPRRAALFAECADELSAAARAFWEARPDLLRRGVAHGGKFERYFHIFRRSVLPLAHSRRRIERLLEPRSRAERETFYEEEWNNRRWRALFRVFFSRWVMGRLGRDPEFFRYVEGSVAERILARVRHALVELDPAENPYLHYILTGNFRAALPLALRSESFAPIQNALRETERFRIHEGTLEGWLANGSGQRFDAFNLSDIFEYMSESATARLLGEITRHARPGARLAYWNMLAPRERPEALAAVIEPQRAEAAQLFARDKAFFYSRFIVESIIA